MVGNPIPVALEPPLGQVGVGLAHREHRLHLELLSGVPEGLHHPSIARSDGARPTLQDVELQHRRLRQLLRDQPAAPQLALRRGREPVQLPRARLPVGRHAPSQVQRLVVPLTQLAVQLHGVALAEVPEHQRMPVRRQLLYLLRGRDLTFVLRKAFGSSSASFINREACLSDSGRNLRRYVLPGAHPDVVVAALLKLHRHAAKHAYGLGDLSIYLSASLQLVIQCCCCRFLVRKLHRKALVLVSCTVEATLPEESLLAATALCCHHPTDFLCHRGDCPR
mmetsp:Transcript_51775/g.148439  ORF Transcript_51775/g.148439 Transcript_51775/m.148439 type:complete len:279 (-) Transcript_51775:417-1253(-)